MGDPDEESMFICDLLALDELEELPLALKFLRGTDDGPTTELELRCFQCASSTMITSESESKSYI